MIRKISEQELAQVVQTLKALERERQNSAVTECEKIAEMGKILLDTKGRLGHGMWVDWAEKNLPFSRMTANRYMKIASNVTTLLHFFPLGKSIVYELAEVPSEKLWDLTPDSVINGKRLRDMNCCEVSKAFSTKPPKPHTYAHDYIKYLATIKANNPTLWDEIDDDIAALLSDGQLEAHQPTGKLKGKTRDERAQEVIRLLQNVLDLIDDIDDVNGKLSKKSKAKIMTIAQLIWRESVRLPAYAILAKKAKAPQPPVKK